MTRRIPLHAIDASGATTGDSLIVTDGGGIGWAPAQASSPDLASIPVFRSPTPSTVASLVETILNNATRYTLGTWLPTEFPGTDPVTPPANTHDDVRPITAAAFGLAACLATGLYDETITGQTEAAARDACLRLTSGLAASHVANGGMWGGTEGVAPPTTADTGSVNWQGALWATMAAGAAWLTQDDLAPTDLDNVAAMIAHEADRMIGWTVPYYRDTAGTVVFTGDTKAEEIAWNAGAVQLALMMTPDHPNAGQWLDKLLEMGLAAYSIPADLTNDARVNGLVVSNTLNGSNANSDGTVTNHGFVNVDYICSGFEVMWGPSLLFSATGRPVPEALQWNPEKLYAALSTVEFTTADGYAAPGGTFYIPGSGDIYHPEGSSWGTDRAMNVALADVVAMVCGYDTGLDTTAEAWALLHLQKQADMQARGTSGQTYYAAGEDTYVGREQWVAHLAGVAAIALCTGTPTVSNAHAQVLIDQGTWQAPAEPDPEPTATAATTALVPLTTVVGGVPELVWEADDSLALTEVPL